MERYFDFSLTEEQMAAYLDGMLDSEESNMVESLIASDPDLQQIEEDLDAIDSTYIAQDPTEELPVEVLADDFSLPEIDGTDHLFDNHEDSMHDDVVDTHDADGGTHDGDESLDQDHDSDQDDDDDTVVSDQDDTATDDLTEDMNHHGDFDDSFDDFVF